jgi:hypothetical protein
LTETAPSIPDGSYERGRLERELRRDLDTMLDALVRGREPAPGGLLAARGAAAAIERATEILVSDARRAGHTWRRIGELLSISRQAAHQRFGDGAVAADPASARLLERATEIVAQMQGGRWEAAAADFTAPMAEKVPVSELSAVWSQILASAGLLREIGAPTVTRRGPFRVVDVPLAFEHGPMKARVSFDHEGSVAGLFILLPDAP